MDLPKADDLQRLPDSRAKELSSAVGIEFDFHGEGLSIPEAKGYKVAQPEDGWRVERSIEKINNLEEDEKLDALQDTSLRFFTSDPTEEEVQMVATQIAVVILQEYEPEEINRWTEKVLRTCRDHVNQAMVL